MVTLLGTATWNLLRLPWTHGRSFIAVGSTKSKILFYRMTENVRRGLLRVDEDEVNFLQIRSSKFSS